ncbi:PLP-dependent aminotransferase family protein [Lysobacter sp. 5GHs7-4]|uniref:MocR-like pyridoxine biosynthesis transcription factor PdxR n=1 Tax=Lysobacter sp. 5GHs7-4 TaxID=2904253 RepID=UPI001E4A4ED8|nr:PLP-dependent aminotransferase family protein [Lysobacter sp. 5GHs7-4]UHQ24213.1 PLP-dependent aminotransferase family protein [Lysobacter sp. 5GHs7-4]
MAQRPASDAVVPFVAVEADARPLYRQIYDGYRAAILEGRLRAGQRIPSTRALARELGISRLPVLTAFEQLLHEGYLEGRAGSGTFVAAPIHDLREATALAARVGPKQGAAGPEFARAPASHARKAPEPKAELGAFRVSQPALDHFPNKLWARLVTRHARAMSIESMSYGDPAGHLPLRHAVADYLRTARAVACDASQVLIVSGSQMALHLCARVLLKPGDRFYFENPGYPGARAALSATGARLQPLPVDGEGLQLPPRRSARRPARAVYVTPSHQYPLGVSMNVSRRLEWLAWAREHQAWIVEDDYDSDYRFSSRPLGALQGMNGAEQVIYTGTFSKVLFPSLRIGYLVAPPALVEQFVAQRLILDLFPQRLDQLVLTDFLCEGHFSRHLRRMRAIYQGRRDALVREIDQHLRGLLTIVNADAGMHLTARLPAGFDDAEVVRLARARGISAIALSSCYATDAADPGLILGFGGVSEAEIVRGVQTLSELLADIARRRRVPRT